MLKRVFDLRSAGDFKGLHELCTGEIEYGSRHPWFFEGFIDASLFEGGNDDEIRMFLHHILDSDSTNLGAYYGLRYLQTDGFSPVDDTDSPGFDVGKTFPPYPFCYDYVRYRIPYRYREEIPELIELLERTSERAAGKGDTGMQARCLHDIAVIGRIHLSLKRRTDYLESALRCFRDAGDTEGIVVSLFNLSGIYLEVSPDRARQMLNDALTLARKYELDREELLLMNQFGFLEILDGIFEKGLEILFNNITRAELRGDLLDLVHSYRYVTYAYSFLEDYESTRKYSWNMMSLLEGESLETGMVNEIFYHSFLANAREEYSRGNLEPLLFFIEKVAEFREDEGIDVSVMPSMKLWPMMYLYGFDYSDRYLPFCRRNTTLLENISPRRPSSKYVLQTDRKDMMAELNHRMRKVLSQDDEDCGEILERMGIHYAQIGIFFFTQNAFREAIPYFQRQLEMSELKENHFQVVNMNVRIAQSYFNLGEIDPARTFASLAWSGLDRMDDMSRYRLISLYHIMGLLAEEDGNFEKALSFYREGLSGANRTAGSFRLRDMKMVMESRRILRSMLSRSIDLLVKRIGDHERAFMLLDRETASVLTQSLRVPAGAADEEAIPEQSRKMLDDLEERLKVIQWQYLLAVEDTTPSYGMVEKRLLNTLFQHRKARILALLSSSHNPERRVPGDIVPLSMEDIQERFIAPNEIILNYFIGDERICLFIMGKHDFQCIPLKITGSEVQQLVYSMMNPLARPSNLSFIPFDFEKAHLLYERLIRPAEEYIDEGVSLIVVPDGILNYLPFELLVTDIEEPADYSQEDNRTAFRRSDRVHFLVEKYPLSYIPSVQLLNPDLHSGIHMSRTPKVLAIGDPDLSGECAGRDREPAFPAGFKRLTHSKREVETIAGLYRNAKIYLGDDATEHNFKSAASGCDIVHLATHGFISDWDPDYSFLIFSTCDTKDDGLFHCYEMDQVTFDAALVTLSACETGLGRYVRGEGIVGFVRSLILRGVPSVVGSMWKVDDYATMVFMDQFYRNLASGNGNIVDILRNVKLSMIAGEGETAPADGGRSIDLRHPYYWAAFILVGSRSFPGFSPTE
jgi:CHAT domain-containing protein